MLFWKICWNPVGILLDSGSLVGIQVGVISTGSCPNRPMLNLGFINKQQFRSISFQAVFLPDDSWNHSSGIWIPFEILLESFDQFGRPLCQFDSSRIPVLYTPPQNPDGLQMDSINLSGLHLDSIWTPTEKDLNQQFVQNSSGVHVDSTWNPSGLQINFTLVP